MQPRSGRPAAALMLAACLCVAACSAGEAGSRAPATATLDVFAASSLTDAFVELAAQAEQATDIDVRLTFAGSQTLRLQLEQGAAADLFASADRAHVVALRQAGMVGVPRRFASNQLALVVPADGDQPVNDLAGLDRAARLVVGTVQVPVGAYTVQLFANGAAAYGPEWGTAVAAAVVSHEANVRLLRAKVELGEADAGVVYRSDTVGRTALRPVPIPPSLNVAVDYYIAPVAGARQTTAAQLWLRHLTSAAGVEVLRRWGFAAGEQLSESRQP